MRLMLRTLALCAVVAVNAASSCAKIENSTTDKKYYRYSFDVADVTTRAVLEYDGVYWEENDAVGMFLQGGHYEANVNIETSPKTLSLASATPITSGSTAYAYYPYDSRNSSVSAAIVGIPCEQFGGAVSAMPMAGIPFQVTSGDTSGSVRFLNLGAIIDFRVFSSTYADETVKYIIFKADSGNVSGDAVIDLSAIDPADEETLAIGSWGTNHYDYVVAKQDAPVASTKETATSVYMVVAPGEYASGKIIIGTDKATYSFNYSNKPLARNELKHYNMNLNNATRQLAYSEYSGDITEGDYVIYYGGYAMKNTVSSNRFSNSEVTPICNQIVLPDASIVWHIAKSGSYWTIYNASVNRYAAGNGTKNQTQLLASGSDNMSLWTVTGTSAYEFVNKSNSSAEINANLRNNGTYGFACYSIQTGGSLTLYKKGFYGSVSGDSGSGGSGASVSGLQYLGCIEVPTLSLEDNEACTASGTETFGSTKWYAYNTTTSTRRIATHTYEYKSKHYRNYTVMVDQNQRCPLWVAYPMHKGAYPSNSLGRVGEFKTSTSYDPAFARSWQSSGSTSDYNGGKGYARGHLCASADRQAVEEANEQTFYYTNQAPQIQNSFNSGVWSALEADVQSNAPTSANDTLYVVSGVLFETGNTGSSNDGGTVGRPSHFYKLLMRCTYSGGTINSAQGVAYIYENKAHTGENYNAAKYRTTIDSIETRAGFDFFPQVPTALQSAAESTSASLW